MDRATETNIYQAIIVKKSEENTEGSNMCLYALKMTVDENYELYRYQKFIDWQQITTRCNLITKQTATKWLISFSVFLFCLCSRSLLVSIVT